MNGTKQDHFTTVLSTQKKGTTFEELMKVYEKWLSFNSFDQDLEAVGYMGAEFMGEYFHKHACAIGMQKDARVLDVAAGTGIQGVILKEIYGYTGLDATDGSKAMLEKAHDTGVYNNIYCCRIGDGYKLPMPDDTYDAAVMTGGLAEGHLKCDAFLELIRVVKPGGLIVNVMRENNIRVVDEYTQLQPLFRKWEEEKRWECVEEVIPHVKYYMNHDGLVHVYRVL